MNPLGFERGHQRIWPDFCLLLDEDIMFQPGSIYQLSGPNGSGKSSFINQLLIPALKKRELWLLHFEQQASLQLQAVRAWAAIFNSKQRVSDEEGLILYLLSDLQRSYQKQPRPVWIVADELHNLQLLAELELPHTLIYSAHHQRLKGCIPIHFEPLSSSRSRVYA